MQFNQILKQKLVENNQRQKDLALLLNTTQQTISNYLLNKNEPDIQSLKKMATHFQCSIDYLVGLENEDGMIIMSNELSDSENYLIDMIRKLSKKNKDTLYDLAELMTQSEKL